MKRYERPGNPPLQKWEPIDPEALVGLEVKLTIPAPRHTIESHEQDYLAAFGHPCDDPDCEFHGDIRFEDTIG